MKILIAEDEAVSRKLLEGILRKWGYEVFAASDGTAALSELEKPEAPQLVISDWMMPGMDGLELCSRIRDIGGSDYVYFILLTARGRREDVVKGLEAGADDYLVKPFDQQELKYRVRIGQRILELESRIKQLAVTDHLTGVLNRRALMERLESEIHRSIRERGLVSFLMADIDHFKEVNDSFGHRAGDIVLQQFAASLCENSRCYDFVGRYGGEEFILCLPGTGPDEATSIAERIRKKVEETPIVLPERADRVRITVSLGVVSFDQKRKESLDSLINRMDEAMYKAKSQGRNRVCVAERQE